jgi:hypothetical protein
MALFHSPKTSTAGLVFMYDTGNSKSYVGEPTTNTAGTTNLATYWNNSGTASWSTDDTNVPRLFPDIPVISMEKLTDGNSHIGVGYTSATVSTEYTYSVYVWIPSTNSSSMAGIVPYFRPQPSNSSIGYLSYNGSTSWGTWPRDQWIRISVTSTTPSTNVTTAYISCYLDTTGDKIYFTSPQFEQKGHITPFVNGTRSTTQGLIDRTGNSTIDLASMSYNSNAQKSFDGTDDYMAISDPNVSSSDGFSIEIVTKPENISSAPVIITPNSEGIDHFARFNSDGSVYFRMVVAADSTTQDFATTTQLTSGNYHHVVFTFRQSDGGKVYYNGELESSAAANFTAKDWSNIWRIGQRGNGTWYYQGELPILKVYNQALTSTEITKNFNAIRSRFGL